MGQDQRPASYHFIEGGDTAGKGGTIEALTERLSPRVFASWRCQSRRIARRVINVFAAVYRAAPAAVIFDRSWYNRAGAERVIGFVRDRAYKRFLELCPEIEKHIVDASSSLRSGWKLR